MKARELTGSEVSKKVVIRRNTQFTGKSNQQGCFTSQKQEEK